MNINKKCIYVFAAAVFVSLAGCKNLLETAEGKKFTQPEGVTLMTEKEIRSTLVGNTYQGESVRYPGSSYIEFVHPDGKISGLWDGKDRYKYKTTRGCNTLAKSGDSILWYGLDGSYKGGKSVVMAGDPNNLAQ